MLSPPHRISRRDDALLFEWRAGDAPVRYPARTLRLACQCAGCIDEMTSRPLLDPATVPEGIAPLGLELVGNYGLKVTWSDGHSAGIYTWEHLRRLAGTP